MNFSPVGSVCLDILYKNVQIQHELHTLLPDVKGCPAWSQRPTIIYNNKEDIESGIV